MTIESNAAALRQELVRRRLQEHLAELSSRSRERRLALVKAMTAHQTMGPAVRKPGNLGGMVFKGTSVIHFSEATKRAVIDGIREYCASRRFKLL